MPLTSATFTGLRSVDPTTLEVARSVNATSWEILRHLRVPYALPSIFSVAKIALTLTLLGAVIAELTGISTAGLGNVFRVAWSGSKNVNQAWAAVFCTAFLGVLTTAAVSAVERRMLRWHSSQISQ
ncbi:MAG: ABC transporter permease subunit [Acidimicrobiales bacterium]